MIDSNYGCLALSGIQHYLFCQRQWALIHIEQQWQENYLTAAGRVLHARAHDGSCRELRGDLLIVRAMQVGSFRLQIHGECDVVEYHRDPQGIALAHTEGKWLPYPVEYKRGQRKSSNCDRAQLCAQAICLEEMHGCSIPEGALYYGQEAHRELVAFDHELRQLVQDSYAAMHALFIQGINPLAKYSKSCDNCSLYEVCAPKLSGASVSHYLQRDLEDK
ncbi:MAG: CRISPR-associated protein Cas4 [bacterium]|nr:CRISPR-associated protein Cas4 [bacterium]